MEDVRICGKTGAIVKYMQSLRTVDWSHGSVSKNAECGLIPS